MVGVGHGESHTLVNRAMTDYTGLVVDRNAAVPAVGDVMVSISDTPNFTSDSVAVRTTWRFGHHRINSTLRGA